MMSMTVYACSDCSFLSKSVAASDAGAVAVIVRDNDVTDSQLMIDMIDDGTARSVDIAAFFMNGKDGSVSCSVLSSYVSASVCHKLLL